MPELRPTHRGSIVARSTWRRCWRGLWVLGAFCFASSILQNTIALQQGNLSMAADLERQENERQELELRRRELLETREFLQSRAGILAEARKLGFGRPGEHRALSESPR